MEDKTVKEKGLRRSNGRIANMTTSYYATTGCVVCSKTNH